MYRVLLLDDDALFQRVLQDALLTKGVGVSVASSIQDAQQILDEAPVDLALVDLYLPDGSGGEWCRQVRERSPDTILVLMTARSEVRDPGRPSEWLFDDFFVKTNSIEELLWRVDIHLSQAGRLRVRRRREQWLAGLVRLSAELAMLQEPSLWMRRAVVLLGALPDVSAVRLELRGAEGFGAHGEGEPQVFSLDPSGETQLLLWVGGEVEPDLLQSLRGVVASSLLATRVLESLRERQARLERGYLERQRQLARMSHRLDRLSEARDSFLALVSHDLRSPISVVMGNCQMLEEGLLGPAQQRRAFETMRRQTERMGRMVEELLDRYRLGFSGAGEPESGDLTRFAREMLETFEPVAARRRQKLVMEAPGPVMIEADLPSLCEVLANLLENSLRHGPEASTVCLEIRPSAGRVEVRVHDEGPGFDGNPEPWGPGLGYRACMRLVAAAGGTMRVGSRPEGGATVTVSLPLPQPMGERGRVEILCGNVDRLERMTEVLGASWPCGTASSSVGVLQRLERDPPAAVVLHGDLPDALGFLRQIKNHPQLGAVPVVFVASSLDPAAIQLATMDGAMSILRPPLDYGELAAMVRKAMRVQAEARVAVAGRAVDELTGLDRADYLDARLDSILDEYRAAGRPVPVLGVDVVDLKAINRAHGWVVGDQLLIWLANSLQERTGPNDLCVRVGGDEFLLLMPGRDMESVKEVGEELVTLVQRARPRLGVARVTVQVKTILVDGRDLPAGAGVDGLMRLLREGKHGT
ncbi:MAG TPA: response regulator [Myxococcota bacterium]|nr:response regulator [Myxococcota bacterium]